MIFKVTRNNIERGRGGLEMYFAFSVANPIFEQNVSTILQLLVWARYLYIALVLNELYEPKLVCIVSVVNHLKIPVFHSTVVACLTMANENRVVLAFSDWRNLLLFPVKRGFVQERSLADQ